ncbi:glycosyltransferase [Wenzhouxiangella sp. AB-CW3]|uniref:glycosyltransferase n=1 Tax=Wenzhouxiangella sp. AB-CW3 TaxID=2771012 RepID=UPI00168A6A5E|nr:glycosyltransferase [Wenzhouxiangella sp. AB-CW3]QOC22007.1 glycosyltransferase [Wenzhouxiangella sp. AB-CW3]
MSEMSNNRSVRQMGSKLPLVSVIIPAFNAARFLPRALVSVAGQSYPAARIETIVIDDGSTDNTLAIAQALEGQVSGVKVFSQPNQGVAAARNLAIAVSSGELIAFLDADDRWLPDKIAAQVGIYQADPDVGLIHCGFDFVDQHGTALPDWPRRSRLDQGDVLLEFLCDFFLITSAVMVPRKVLEKVGGFDETLKVGEDNELFLRIVSAYLVGCAPQILLERTVRPDSLSREDFDLDARVDLATIERYLVQHPDFARQHRERIDDHLATYLYGFGYRLLDEGQVSQARTMLRRSLSRRWSVPATRSLLRSYLPEALARSGRAALR